MPYPSEEDFYASGDPDVGDARPLSDIDGTGRALPSLLGEMGDAWNELNAELDTQVTEVADAAAQAALTTHTSDTVDAHDASAISFVPTGTVAATTVQAAIVEVNTEKSATTHTHTLDDLTDVATPAPTDGQVLKWSASSARWAPSTDLVGGGGGGAVTMGDLTDVDLTGLVSGNGITYNGTDFVPTDLATQAELNTDATNLANHLADTVDAHDASAISFVPAGTIAATTVQAAIEEVASEAGGGGGGLTTEEVQDVVGGMVVSGNNITATYSDAANTLVVSVNPLDHNDITDWTSEVREVVAGTGVTVATTSTETEITALQPIITDYTPGSYTWTKGADVKMVEVICVGAGGGGGSGSRGSAAGVIRGGGGGGASGNHARFLFSAAECATNEAVVVGSGGAGGPAVTTNGVNGNAGSAGGITSFGALLAASGGSGGGGGVQGASGAGGTAGALGTRGTNAGFTGAVGAGAAAATIVANFLLNNASNGFVSGSGGGGASIDASNNVQGGSNGGAGPFHRTSATPGGSYVGTGVAGGAGSATGTYGGSGGGGGGAGTAAASGAGGLGARGAGGGGSGGAAAGFNAAAGGAGGGGFCRVIEYR